ncbi:DNA polymerase-3 subunit alpha (Gram-positive type) [Bacilli bacterium PM5-9]|nr:DNA polymerase-3 subunit alpha (Gram-positive type) [Bacilli bacterium PM5-9]
MEQNLKKFLKEIKINEEYFSYFEETQLVKAEYIESAQLILAYLDFVNVLPLDVYKLLEEKTFEHDHNMKIIYEVKQAVYLDEYVYDYYNYFIENKLLDDSNSYLKKINLEYKNRNLIVKFANEGLKLMFVPYQNKLENMMQLAGFNIEYSYEIDENNELDNKIDEMIKHEENIVSKKVNESKPITSPITQSQKQTRITYKKSIKDLSNYETMSIIDLYDDYIDVCVEGFIFDVKTIKTKNGRHIQTIKLSDFSDSIMLKRFEGNGLTIDDLNEIKSGMWIRALGDVRYDNFANEHVLFLKSIQMIKSKTIEKYDTNIEKRVELHSHTNMSTMDGLSTPSEYINQALKYGHSAIAFTDHNNVQAFPDAYHAAANSGLKVIYGMESNLIDDEIKITLNAKCDESLNDATYVFFDFETTGLSSESDEIIEIGAIKYQNGLEIDRFQSFVKPKQKVSLFIKELTGISDSHLQNAPDISVILPDFVSFYEDSVLVAHNATFDIGFLKTALIKEKLPQVDNCVIDTLQLSRVLDKKRKVHNLGACARSYGVAYNTDVAHRADYDAIVLAQVFEGMKHDLITYHEIEVISDINKLCDKSFLIRQRPYHCSILAKNQAGLKDLFKLVSKAHIDYYYGEPRLFKSTIATLRENLLIGSGCLNGEIYQQAKSLDKEQFIKLMDYYDYIEVFPPNNLIHLVDLEEFKSIDEVNDLTKYIIECANEANKIVVASGDAHYVDEKQKEYREVYISALGIGGKIHPLFDRKGRIKNIPNQHFKSTTEMLEDFVFLGDELARKIVIENTNVIADMIEEVKPIKDKLYTPKIAGVDEKLTKMCYENAYAQYGNPLPEIVKERLDKELNSIIKHGFSVVYYISSQLVEKSLSDGYLVGSRGSVGSSLVATLANITEVNPLVAHYYCPNCSYSEFFEDGSVSSGYDLEDKECPHCQTMLKGDGQDIPFETFLGFEGDKVPDIDLNFSSEYQPVAHNYTKELFGEDYVFRAGTIGTVQNKTAYGYAKGYHEKKNTDHDTRGTEYERLAMGCEGVKRTTGQHPGGIIVIPDYMDVHDFTPINYPADDIGSSWKTTHFDFHAIHDNVLKLDILGHVDPTAIRMLQDLTGIDPKTIPTNDKKVLSLFSSNDAIEISDKVNYKNAAIGIPEFGTQFVRSMLEETDPKTFAELVQISGLSHGTDVWLNNAQSLIKRNICTLKEVIGCRDDIMVYLMYKGLEPKLSFTIMEAVRKGKGLKDEWIEAMHENNVPQWYIESCEKIKYMFPKAHAVAYVLMAIRVAWFKVYYPLEYYATYFTTRCDQFDIETMVKGIDAMEAKLKEIEAKGYDASDKEKALVTVFEVAIEMYHRGYSILPVNIDKSLATKFSVDYENNAILPSFISIDSLGVNVAEKVISAREIQPFISKEDLEKRSKLNKNHMLLLERIGSLDHLQDYNQLSLF